MPEQYEVVPEFPGYANSNPGDNPIAHISAGTRHNLAVSKSGHVYAWGLGREWNRVGVELESQSLTR